jgi:hypothetical protein
MTLKGFHIWVITIRFQCTEELSNNNAKACKNVWAQAKKTRRNSNTSVKKKNSIQNNEKTVTSLLGT